jgi:Protein of unknown function (DUF3309)
MAFANAEHVLSARCQVEPVCSRTPRSQTRLLSQRNESVQYFEEKAMTLGTILLIVLILMLIGAIPTWPHSRSWGYAPSGLLGVVLIIIVVLLLMGLL